MRAASRSTPRISLTQLVVDGTNVVLTGGGTVTLGANSDNEIIEAANGDKLTNKPDAEIVFLIYFVKFGLVKLFCHLLAFGYNISQI